MRRMLGVLGGILLSSILACTEEPAAEGQGRPTPPPDAPPPLDLPAVTLTIGGVAIQVEVAATDDARERGLMYRGEMPEDHGMIFVYRASRVLSFWMHNTYLPLSIAFISDDGTILQIEDMDPLDDTIHRSRQPARYALEMNQGWFRANDVAPGARVEGLAEVERAALGTPEGSPHGG